MSFSSTTNGRSRPWLSLLILHRDGGTVNSSYDGLARRESDALRALRDGRKSNSSGGSGSNSTKSSSSNSTDVAKKDVGSFIAETVLEILIASVASFAIYAMGLGCWNIARMIAGGGGQFGGNDTDMDQMKKGSVSRLTELMRRRGRDVPGGGITLNTHESHIAEDIVDPEDMNESFKDIGGLDNLKQEIWELAVLPLTRPELFRGGSKLVSQTSGILLFGRPGCGKTLLAKAIAKESEAIFIPIKLSKILNKWVGESNKLVAATFSLAEKLAPSIIFIDELDTFLSSTVDPSASKSMESLKAEFLTLWDGISTNRQQAPVLVLGATNRPQLIDSAILRRMPRSFQVPLPDGAGRDQILRVFLGDQPMDKQAQAFLSELAHERTKGYSGSDLKELCKAAAMEPIREITAEESRRAVMGEPPLNKKKSTPKRKNTKKKGLRAKFFSDSTPVAGINNDGDEDDTPKARPVSKKDFMVALTKVKRTGQSAHEYGRTSARQDAVEAQVMDAQMAAAHNPMSILQNMSEEQMAQIQAMLSQFMQPANNWSSNGRNNNDGDDDIGNVPNLN